MKRKIISLTTSSLLVFQNVLYIPNVYAQEINSNLILDTQNKKSQSIVYLSDADGSTSAGDGSQERPYQNIRTALDNVTDGGIIKLIGDVTYTEYDTHTDGSAMPLMIDKDVIIEGASDKSPLAGDADALILRAPIQLDANVTFRNINLQLVPEVILGKSTSNNKILGQHNPLGSTIFVAGNALTLDNVNTKVGTNSDQYNNRPYISGGTFKGLGNIGDKSVINIINPNSETILSGIYAGDYWYPRTLNVEINLDCKVLEDKIYTGGLSSTLNGTVNINLGGKSTVYSFNNTNHQGEVNVNIKPNITRTDIDLAGVNNLSLEEGSKLLLKKNSEFNLNNVTLKNNSLIDFREIQGNPTVKGNFTGYNGSILLQDSQLLDVTGELTGTTKLNYDGGVFSESLTDGHEYVRAKSDSHGDFTIKQDLSDIFKLEKNPNNNNRTTWTIKRIKNVFKDFKWVDCPDVITNPTADEEYIFPIEFKNINDNIYLPYNEDWDDFSFTITKADGTELDEESSYDDEDVYFHISYFDSTIVLTVYNTNYTGDITLTAKHIPTSKTISKTVTIQRELKDITGSVSITGDTSPGNIISAKVTNIPSDAKNLKYTWYLNDSIIKGESNNTLSLTENHKGVIRVEVSAENYNGILVSNDVTVKLPEKPVVVKPKTVSGVKAVSNGYNSNKITWSSPGEVDGYEIYYSTSKTGTYSLMSTTNTVNYAHSGLTTGKTYYYKVRAYKIADGKKVYGDYSSIVEAKPTLSSVTAKVSSASYNSNKITWNKVSGANGYVVYRATSKDGTYSACKTITSGSTVSYTDTTLTTGKTYYYKVRAYRTVDSKKVYGGYSSIISSKPTLSSVTAKVSSASYNSNKITWNKVSGANGYVVYRATSKDGTYSACKTITSSSTVSYTDTTLTTGKTYYYKVRAYRTVNGKKVYGGYSSIISSKPKLNTPSITLKTSSNKATVKWSKIPGASSYEIYRSTSKSDDFSKVKTITSGSTTSYTNSKLSKGKTYYYKIRAYRTVNGKKVYSSYSSVKSIKIK